MLSIIFTHKICGLLRPIKGASGLLDKRKRNASSFKKKMVRKGACLGSNPGQLGDNKTAPPTEPCALWCLALLILCI